MSRPKVGLALGSGAARGLAHIGVLKVLQQEGIPVDLLAGSSMGSLVAVLYANRLDLEMVEKLAIHLKRKHWLDFKMPGLGFVTGERIKELVRLLTHGKQLEELSIPTAVVATDLVKGERVVFTSGPIDFAVRASISIPGIFEPVFRDGEILIDGGVIDRVPVTAVRDLGADFVIAVDVAPREATAKVEGIFDVIIQTIGLMEREIMSNQLLSADVAIFPDVAEFSPTAFTQVEKCIQRGEEAARAQVERIKELIQEREGVKANGD